MRNILNNFVFGLLLTTVLVSCQKKPEAGFNIVSVNANGDNEVNIYKKVIFQNTSINGNSYEWDFGDGNISSDTDPEYQYSEPGLYTVILKAFSENGKAVSTATEGITVNRWRLTGLNFSFNDNPVFWGDSAGCFEPGCDTLNARIYFYYGNSLTSAYVTPLMPMGQNSTNNAIISIDSSVFFTNDIWSISFIHEYSSGAGYKFAEYSFNPVLTPDNGFVNNKFQHYIGFSSGNIGIGLTLYFDKKPE